MLPGELAEPAPTEIVIPVLIQRPPEPPPLDASMLVGTPFCPLWLDENGAVKTLLFDHHTYHIEESGLLTRVMSEQTRRRRAEAMKRLGHKSRVDRTIDENVQMMVDGLRSRPVC